MPRLPEDNPSRNVPRCGGRLYGGDHRTRRQAGCPSGRVRSNLDPDFFQRKVENVLQPISAWPNTPQARFWIDGELGLS